MVKVLSCYHFRGQKIGRCDEATAVTVAGQAIVVGIDDSITIYNAGHSYGDIHDDSTYDIGSSGSSLYQIPEIGAPIVFEKSFSPGEERRFESDQQRSGSCSSSASSIESETEIKLSHSFPTVDLVRYLSYNKKGNYLLCLECRDGDDGSNKCSNIRVYFHWNKKQGGQPMRTRIAGVSPSANDLEKPALTVVEIPLTSPAIAVASCNLSGHLASLSAESVVNIFCFRMKDVSGRGKMQYHDFDRLCAVEMPGFAPENISFLGNFVTCYSPSKVHIFQLRKCDKSWSPSVISTNQIKSKGRISGRDIVNTPRKKSHAHFDYSNKVTYDPSDDSVTVHLPSIVRANRKRSTSTILVEEYGSEILTNKAKIIFASPSAAINIEDVLRLSFPAFGSNPTSNDRFSGAVLYPIRLNGI